MPHPKVIGQTKFSSWERDDKEGFIIWKPDEAHESRESSSNVGLALCLLGMLISTNFDCFYTWEILSTCGFKCYLK